MLLILSAVLLFYSDFCQSVQNNVCKNFEDYRTIDTNPNCWYNPDVFDSPKEIAQRYGFPFEIHEIETNDGYLISLFRIPHNGTRVNAHKPIVFLQHGIAADGSTWMTQGLKSIVFVFANRGCDVWISNSRGTKYSKRHKKFTVHDPQYWNFSFHEMAIYDLPAILNYISAKTGQRNITYIGHSMGSTISYVYASLLPKHARYHLKSIISLAPVAFMDNVKNLRIFLPFSNFLWNFFSSIGLYGFGPNIQFKLDLIHKLCIKYPFIITCALTSALLAGINTNEVVLTNAPVELSHFPSGFSLKTLMHYVQILKAKQRFQFFDYGSVLNRKFYNSLIPPEYPLGQIKTPIHLFYGRNDLISREKDVYHLFRQLTTEKTIMEVYNFAHLDFLSSVHALDFYEFLLKYL